MIDHSVTPSYNVYSITLIGLYTHFFNILTKVSFMFKFHRRNSKQNTSIFQVNHDGKIMTVVLMLKKYQVYKAEKQIRYICLTCIMHFNVSKPSPPLQTLSKKCIIFGSKMLNSMEVHGKKLQINSD